MLVMGFAFLLAIFPLYSRYKVAAAPVPPGVHLGGLDLSDLKDTAEIRRHLDQIYQAPIDVRFGVARLVLRPEDIDFHVDVEQMVAEASRYLEGSAFLDIAVREALGFDQQRRDVPVRFTVDENKLRAWLETVASEQNHAPTPPRLLPPSARWVDGGAAAAGLPAGYVGTYTRDWLWIPGQPGETLDIDAGIPLIVAALTSEDDRLVHLSLTETPAPAPTLDDLAREINTYLLDFPGFGAAYIQDLQTGEEGFVDADVSFSGMSTLKIGLAAAIMRELPHGVAADDDEAGTVGNWLDYALGESNNHAANQLITFLGDGDITAGTQRFTEFMRSLAIPAPTCSPAMTPRCNCRRSPRRAISAPTGPPTRTRTCSPRPRRWAASWPKSTAVARARDRCWSFSRTQSRRTSVTPSSST